MRTSHKKGILVTGAPRSGTSWMGRMLSLAPHTRYLHEPLNNRFAVDHFKEEPFPYWFMYLNKQNQHLYIDKISRMIDLSPIAEAKASTKPKPVIKDPIAVFSANWFAHTYDLDVVFLIRHPGAFIKSILTLEWNTKPRMFFRQESLMEAYLSDYETELRKHQDLDNKFAQAALMWKMIYHVANIFQKQNPNWQFIRHEDLSTNPASGFRSIYAQLGLEYTYEASMSIASHSSQNNPIQPEHHWDIKRNSLDAINSWFEYFTRDQIDLIREIVEPVSSMFYKDNEWPGE